jgi:hypothetical protein
MRGSQSATAVMMVIGIWSFGCRRQAVNLSPPVSHAEEHCWWAVMRSPLPPDSVAARFQRAFIAVGLTNAMWTHKADTAWVHGGPTALAASPGATYESRVVAYWHGDSTHYRQYVAVAPQPGESRNLGQRTIPFCTTTARAAAVLGSAPQAPTGDETLELWRRVP